MRSDQDLSKKTKSLTREMILIGFSFVGILLIQRSLDLSWADGWKFYIGAALIITAIIKSKGHEE